MWIVNVNRWGGGAEREIEREREREREIEESRSGRVFAKRN